MISDGGSFGHLGVHVGTDGRVWCNTYADTTPILSVNVASTTVAFCLEGKSVGAEAVEFARKLAREARRFADEAERLHAEHQAVERVRAEARPRARRDDSQAGGRKLPPPGRPGLPQRVALPRRGHPS